MLKAIAQAPATTRERILDAAFETLRRHGFARTSARAIARTGGFNQALIFYHFGAVTDLLLAALDRVSVSRIERYREVLGAASSLPDLPPLARRLYMEDVECGHATVLAELFAASSGNASLRDEMLKRMRPWLDFTESLIERFTDGTPFGSLVNPHAAAGALLAMYVGLDLLTNLDGDRARVTKMFDAADRAAQTLAPLMTGFTK